MPTKIIPSWCTEYIVPVKSWYKCMTQQEYNEYLPTIKNNEWYIILTMFFTTIVVFIIWYIISKRFN